VSTEAVECSRHLFSPYLDHRDLQNQRVSLNILHVGVVRLVATGACAPARRVTWRVGLTIITLEPRRQVGQTAGQGWARHASQLSLDSMPALYVVMTQQFMKSLLKGLAADQIRVTVGQLIGSGAKIMRQWW
jgi:hypothetical protein